MPAGGSSKRENGCIYGWSSMAATPVVGMCSCSVNNGDVNTLSIGGGRVTIDVISSSLDGRDGRGKTIDVITSCVDTAGGRGSADITSSTGTASGRGTAAEISTSSLASGSRNVGVRGGMCGGCPGNTDVTD